MSPTETVRLAALVAAIAPAQRMEDGTAQAWHGLLDDLRLADCVEAVRVVGRRQPFIAPADIRQAVRAARDERIAKGPPYDPSSGLTVLEWRRRLADGELMPEPVGLVAGRPVMLAIANAFRKVPNA